MSSYIAVTFTRAIGSLMLITTKYRCDDDEDGGGGEGRRGDSSTFSNDLTEI
jgi:hypothetical protein